MTVFFEMHLVSRLNWRGLFFGHKVLHLIYKVIQSKVNLQRRNSLLTDLTVRCNEPVWHASLKSEAVLKGSRKGGIE